MGEGINLYCPNCGFNDTFYLGVGFSYPRVFTDTMEMAKKGRLGKKLKKLLVKHPEAVIDFRAQVVRDGQNGLADGPADDGVFPGDGHGFILAGKAPGSGN